MKFLASLLALIVHVAVTVHAQKNTVSQQRPISNFENIHIKSFGSTQVNITFAHTVDMHITADENIINWIEACVSDNTLTITTLKNFEETGKSKIEINITVPLFKKIEASGSRITVYNRFDAASMEIKMLGSSSIVFKEGGSVEKLSMNILGDGSINALKIKAKDVSASVVGAGRIVLSAETHLVAKVTEGGSIIYEGDPDIIPYVRGEGQITGI